MRESPDRNVLSEKPLLSLKLERKTDCSVKENDNDHVK